MAHVTFIHGIANKPPADALHELWLGSLAQNGGLDLRGRGVTSAMVYWADVLYESPLTTQGEGFESTGTEIPEQQGPNAPPLTQSQKEAVLLAGLAMKFGMVAGAPELASPDVGGLAPDGFERIPLPGFVVKRAMEAYLRDVHHYLFNVTFSPRPGVTYAVQDEVRQRLIKALISGERNPGPHILVSHSMGTVIAYDCLRRVPGCPSVDGLMTIGSPLGLDEVQDGLQPGWTRGDGFPSNRLAGDWCNVFDRLDPVAGFDAYIATDYLRNGKPVITDIHEPNFGWWRHDIGKYMRGAKLRAALGNMLKLGS